MFVSTHMLRLLFLPLHLGKCVNPYSEAKVTPGWSLGNVFSAPEFEECFITASGNIIPGRPRHYSWKLAEECFGKLHSARGVGVGRDGAVCGHNHAPPPLSVSCNPLSAVRERIPLGLVYRQQSVYIYVVEQTAFLSAWRTATAATSDLGGAGQRFQLKWRTETGH